MFLLHFMVPQNLSSTNYSILFILHIQYQSKSLTHLSNTSDRTLGHILKYQWISKRLLDVLMTFFCTQVASWEAILGDLPEAKTLGNFCIPGAIQCLFTCGFPYCILIKHLINLVLTMHVILLRLQSTNYYPNLLFLCLNFQSYMWVYISEKRFLFVDAVFKSKT